MLLVATETSLGIFAGHEGVVGSVAGRFWPSISSSQLPIASVVVLVNTVVETSESTIANFLLYASYITYKKQYRKKKDCFL